MALTTFHKFFLLPAELRLMIWEMAGKLDVEEVPRIHYFTVDCPKSCLACNVLGKKLWAEGDVSFHLTPSSATRSTEDQLEAYERAIRPAKPHNSTHTWKLSKLFNSQAHHTALWNVCPEAAHVVNPHGNDVVIAECNTPGKGNQYVPILPERDLLFLGIKAGYHTPWKLIDYNLNPPFGKAGVENVAIPFKFHEWFHWDNTWPDPLDNHWRLTEEAIRDFAALEHAIKNVLGRVKKIWFVDFDMERMPGALPIDMEDRQVFHAPGYRFVEVKWPGILERANTNEKDTGWKSRCYPFAPSLEVANTENGPIVLVHSRERDVFDMVDMLDLGEAGTQPMDYRAIESIRSALSEVPWLGVEDNRDLGKLPELGILGCEKLSDPWSVGSVEYDT